MDSLPRGHSGRVGPRGVLVVFILVGSFDLFLCDRVIDILRVKILPEQQGA